MVHRSLANPSDPEAADTDTLLQPLDKALFADGNPSGIKCLLNLLGLADDVLRLPLVPVSAETRKAIENVLPTLPPTSTEHNGIHNFPALITAF